MNNHLHLAMQAGEQPLSKGLQNLSFRYTRHINRRLDRVGHLFQGRYKALLVDEQSYGLELVRYIHLNPVRAQLVRDPARYANSGHLGYLGRSAFPFLTTDWVLSQFGERVGVARKRYEQFVAEGIQEGHRPEFHDGGEDNRMIGEDRFIERALGALPDKPVRGVDLNGIVEYVCEGMQLTEQELRAAGKERRASKARALVGWLVFATQCATLSDVARRFNRDLSGISRGVSILERTAREGGTAALALHAHMMSISQA
jgi:hypothetical protein